MPQTTATITTLYPAKISKRQTLADLIEPDRAQDEALLRVIQGFEDRGREVVVEGDAPIREDGESRSAPMPSPNNFVSEYLTRPLRTEAEVRALREPRVPKGQGILDPIFKFALSPFRPGGV